MDLWQQFCSSGKIDDYLQYKKQNEFQINGVNNADQNQRLDNTRANDRGE